MLAGYWTLDGVGLPAHAGKLGRYLHDDTLKETGKFASASLPRQVLFLRWPALEWNRRCRR